MSHRWKKTVSITPALLAISLLVACGDSAGGGDPRELCESGFVGSPFCFLPNFEEDVLRPKLEGCVGDPEDGACHAAGSTQSTLELDVTAPGTTVEAEVGALVGQAGLGGLLVDPTCTDSSSLLTKLTATPGGGSRMPLGAAPWSDEEIECFRKYLDDTFSEAPTE